MYCLGGGVRVRVWECVDLSVSSHSISELVAKSSNSFYSGWKMMKERKAINWAVKIPSALFRAPRLQISAGPYCVWFVLLKSRNRQLCKLEGRKVLFIYDAFFLGLSSSRVLWWGRERERVREAKKKDRSKPRSATHSASLGLAFCRGFACLHPPRRHNFSGKL